MMKKYINLDKITAITTYKQYKTEYALITTNWWRRFLYNMDKDYYYLWHWDLRLKVGSKNEQYHIKEDGLYKKSHITIHLSGKYETKTFESDDAMDWFVQEIKKGRNFELIRNN